MSTFDGSVRSRASTSTSSPALLAMLWRLAGSTSRLEQLERGGNLPQVDPGAMPGSRGIAGA